MTRITEDTQEMVTVGFGLRRVLHELRLSAQVFRDYGRQHQDKADAIEIGGFERDSRLAKAKRNLDRAAACEEALAQFRASQLAGVVGERDALRKALGDLETCEEHYRKVHDLNGAGSPATGRAWDLLRRAGDKAREALSPNQGAKL